LNVIDWFSKNAIV